MDKDIELLRELKGQLVEKIGALSNAIEMMKEIENDTEV